MSLFPNAAGAASRLRRLLESEAIVQAPGCYDALSARVLERAGFQAGFLGGFSVAAAKLGLPDVGLLSYGEMLEQSRTVCAAASMPIVADGDTGYGNAINAERTLLGYAQAGVACVMIEDQAWPKRCGHTAGKAIVSREEALARIRGCARVREEHGLDVLIMARTDACATDGFEEALWRCEAFADAGADLTFLEAPKSLEQMQRYCETVPGLKTANLVEDGMTPWLEPGELAEIGYAMILYPVSLLLHSAHAMEQAAKSIRANGDGGGARIHFDAVRALVGWPEYEERLRTLSTRRDDDDETQRRNHGSR